MFSRFSGRTGLNGLGRTKSTFETLEVWKESRKLRKDISRLVKTIPSVENFRLSDQMIRSSRSASANIAEGHGTIPFSRKYPVLSSIKRLAL